MSARIIVTWVLVLSAASAVAAGAVSTSYSASDEGPNPKAVQIAPADGGRLLTVKLAGLDKGAKIVRAHLRVWRGPIKDADDLLATITIYPSAKAGPADSALALVGPGFDAFDATAAVARALAADGTLRLFVKTFPAFQADRTRLEVLYEARGAKPPKAPPAVKGLKAFHRAGQTFITWKEVAPPIASQRATWGEIRTKLAEARVACTYRIYAHNKPINAKTFAQAKFVAEVGPLSCWNVHGRNMEYLIGQAMIKSDRIGELAEGHNHAMYTWGPNHPRMDRYPLDRLVIDPKAGPLPPGTGLYVHHPWRAQKRYYAVVSCRAGVENTADFSAANALAKPLAEVTGPGEPVHQGPGLWGPFFDYPGRRQVYVQWCAPPLAPRHNMYFNWSVLVPPGLAKGEKAPGELYFHTGNFSYAKPRIKMILKSVQIAPHDWPPSGWYGYNDAFRTLASYETGWVRDHTQRRILAFLDWALKTFAIDPNRILLTGSDGAALLALNHPERFAYALINDFSNDALRAPKGGALQMAWGPKCARVEDQARRADWGWGMLDQIVLARRGRDLPLIYCKGYSWGPFVRRFARGKGRFYTAMRKANQPVIADWTWAGGQLIRPDRYTGRWRGLDLTRTTPVPAFANCTTDKDSEGDGNTNLRLGWQPIKETANGAEIVLSNRRGCTVDLAFRRLQRFKPKAGEQLPWEAISSKPRRGETPAPQHGAAIVDRHGVFVLKGLKIARGSNLAVKVTRAK